MANLIWGILIGVIVTLTVFISGIDGMVGDGQALVVSTYEGSQCVWKGYTRFDCGDKVIHVQTGLKENPIVQR